MATTSASLPSRAWAVGEEDDAGRWHVTAGSGGDEASGIQRRRKLAGSGEGVSQVGLDGGAGPTGFDGGARKTRAVGRGSVASRNLGPTTGGCQRR